MDPANVVTLFDWGIKLVMTVGGIGGIAALFMVRAQKRKLVADTGKTDAEADLVLADASMKKVSREARILDMSESVMRSMRERLGEAEAKIDRLTSYVEVLVQALRTAGAPVPPMPRQMSEDAHAGEKAREA